MAKPARRASGVSRVCRSIAAPSPVAKCSATTSAAWWPRTGAGARSNVRSGAPGTLAGTRPPVPAHAARALAAVAATGSPPSPGPPPPAEPQAAKAVTAQTSRTVRKGRGRGMRATAGCGRPQSIMPGAACGRPSGRSRSCWSPPGGRAVPCAPRPVHGGDTVADRDDITPGEDPGEPTERRDWDLPPDDEPGHAEPAAPHGLTDPGPEPPIGRPAPDDADAET